MKKIILTVVIFFVGLCPIASAQNQVTLTTYYPAPFGMYQEMRVMGRLGVGTTNPTSRLHTTGNTWDVPTAFIENTFPASQFGKTPAGSALALSIVHPAIYGLYVDQPVNGKNYFAGNVGIGTTNIEGILHVKPFNALSDVVKFEHIAPSGFSKSGGKTVYVVAPEDTQYGLYVDQPANGKNYFAGNVGIGTTALRQIYMAGGSPTFPGIELRDKGLLIKTTVYNSGTPIPITLEGPNGDINNSVQIYGSITDPPTFRVSVAHTGSMELNNQGKLSVLNSSALPAGEKLYVRGDIRAEENIIAGGSVKVGGITSSFPSCTAANEGEVRIANITFPPPAGLQGFMNACLRAGGGYLWKQLNN